MSPTQPVSLPSRIAGNSAIDSKIKKSLIEIGSQSVADRVVQRLNTLQGNLPKLHVYREILLGLWASRQGFSPEYETKVGSATPDWIVHTQSSDFILEVVSIHNRQEIIEEVETTPELEMKMFDVDSDFVLDKAYSRIEEKVSKYRDLGYPLVIGVHFDFDSCVNADEWKPVSDQIRKGSFLPCLSGVVFFDDELQLEWIENLSASRKLPVTHPQLSLRV